MRTKRLGSSKIEMVLFDYVDDREKYYAKKLNKGVAIKDIIRESADRQDLPILKRLVINKFPHYKELLFKYLLIK